MNEYVELILYIFALYGAIMFLRNLYKCCYAKDGLSVKEKKI